MAAEESNIDDIDSDAKMEDMMDETREEAGADLTMCSAEVLAINSTEGDPTSHPEPEPLMRQR